MNKLNFLFCKLIIILLPIGSIFAQNNIKTQQLNYKIYWLGFNVGNILQNIKITNNSKYDISSQRQLSLPLQKYTIYEKVHGNIQRKNWSPIFYDYEKISANNNHKKISIKFDNRQHKITNIAANKPWNIKSKSFTIDRLSLQFNLSNLLREQKQKLPESITIADGGMLKTYKIMQKKYEKIYLYNQEVITTKLIISDPHHNRSLTFWFGDKEYNFNLVKASYQLNKLIHCTAILYDMH